MRVQPHLKKCFEGIHRLEFSDQQEILGMVSAEKETVPFNVKIFPAKAKVWCSFIVIAKEKLNFTKVVLDLLHVIGKITFLSV